MTTRSFGDCTTDRPFGRQSFRMRPASRLGGAALVLPKIPKAFRRQLGVAHRMLNVLVTEVVLQRARIDALIGQFETSRVPEHVRMDLERHLRGLAQPGDHSPKTNSTHGRPPFAHEHIAARLLLALQSTQSAEFDAATARLDRSESGFPRFAGGASLTH
jgi:hypothetical protein